MSDQRPPQSHRAEAGVGIGLRYAAIVALALVITIGGATMLLSDRSSSPASETGSLGIDQGDDCFGTATTLDPDGSAPPCQPPSSRDGVARLAAIELLGPDRFAGIWYETGGTVLVVGFVGEEPSLEDMPGVDRVIEREMSLVQMEALAAERNASQMGGLFWRVNVVDGVVEGIPDNRDPAESEPGGEL